MMDAALQCAVAGLRVHPLYEVDAGLVCTCWKRAECPEKQRGKHPRLSSWQTTATADADQVRTWWRQWPSAGIGVATGRASRVWVLDCDGEEALTWYKAKCKAEGLVKTRGARTGRGRHFWFRFPEDEGIEIRNAQGIAPGVDVRGDGGYVIAPPTMHRTGTRYEWLTSGAYTEAPELAPAWLLELVRARPTPPPVKVVTVPGRVPWSAKAADEELARRLRLDPSARQYLGERLGGIVNERHVRKVKCPKCQDISVWWMINGTGYAKCSHLKTCGWLAPLHQLL